MRRKLSYANVMATLAFFFALTGGTMAATKYLTPTDPITQGDLAGSTYGNPVIAAGKVTTGKIADGAVTNVKLADSGVTSAKLADGAVTSSKFDSGAVAPNSTQFAGHGLNDFNLVVRRGIDTEGDSTLAAGACEGLIITATGANPSTDMAVVNGPVTPLGFVVNATVDGVNELIIKICNTSDRDQSIAGQYRYMVLR